ncbi:hypothetical protein [Dyella psychrodurans]|uniref:Uncharacterized protein n=1 Tax=Dyella psychrodurans TaxID=1927960 RepID=A0A370X0L5_9GAMM|nr:hypothetical protein [Dyella psychrodurans]RDS81892.1 hypothetical protein DWU99_15855 [Dyella psychrodurans]
MAKLAFDRGSFAFLLAARASAVANGQEDTNIKPKIVLDRIWFEHFESCWDLMADVALDV